MFSPSLSRLHSFLFLFAALCSESVVDEGHQEDVNDVHKQVHECRRW